MSETLCTCTDTNCTEAHDNEDFATYVIWFKGEYSDTMTFADTMDEALTEIQGFVSDAPEDLPRWIVKNRSTKQRQTADKLFAQYGM